jgi:hypothetical protein
MENKKRKGKLVLCDKCHFEVSSFFYNKHVAVCDGIGPRNRTREIRKSRTPPERRPKRHGGLFSPGGWNKGLTKEDPRVAQYIKTSRENGVYERTSAALRAWAKANPEAAKEAERKGGGYRERSGRSHGSFKVDSFGTVAWLQSPYEIRCAELLNELGIRWVRPKFLVYQLGGLLHRYFPDFQLVDFGLYLDPKNDYLAKVDVAKIQAVREQCNVRVEILTKEKLTSEYLSGLCAPII